MSTGASFPVRDFLVADHARLEALAENLLTAARSGDSAEVCLPWSEFEQGVLAHLEAEDGELIPLFEAGHKEETAAIRAAHAHIRQTLDRVGLSIELHEARLAGIEELLRQLRAHAAQEAGLIYRWADENLPASNRERLFAPRSRVIPANQSPPVNVDGFEPRSQ